MGKLRNKGSTYPDPFVLLHRKLTRAALGRIPVLADALQAFLVILRMPQTCPCCTWHPWEWELSSKSLDHAMAPFSLCCSSLHICLTLLPHPCRSMCWNAGGDGNYWAQGHKNDPEAPHRSKGGENKDIFLWIMRALFMLATDRAPASHWHQRCARLSVIAKITVFLESMAYCVLQLLFSCIFLQICVGQWWLMNFKILKRFVGGLLELWSLCWFLDVCPGGTEQWLLWVGNSSYWCSINCSGFYGFLKCETKAGFPAGALSGLWLLLLVCESNLAW